MRTLHKVFAAGMIRSGSTASKVEDWLLKQEVHPVVARDWGNEVTRRATLAERASGRKDRRRYINKKYTGHRRILYRKLHAGREFFLHATKGWRSYGIRT
jgi:hypothetical protein